MRSLLWSEALLTTVELVLLLAGLQKTLLLLKTIGLTDDTRVVRGCLDRKTWPTIDRLLEALLRHHLHRHPIRHWDWTGGWETIGHGCHSWVWARLRDGHAIWYAVRQSICNGNLDTTSAIGNSRWRAYWHTIELTRWVKLSRTLGHGSLKVPSQ